MAHLSGITLGSSIRALAAASMLALAVISIPSSEAHAAPITGGGSSKTCTDPDGNQVAGGTVWTSYTQNGQVASRYRCNGSTGQWDKMVRTAGSQNTVRGPRGGVMAR